jgi:diadenylate cyclase
MNFILLILPQLHFGVLDFVDILLVALLLLELYRLIKGTTAMNVFLGIVAFYLAWKLVKQLHMVLLSEILGQFINVGIIALIIVFQKEIRQFLLLLGTPKFIRNANQNLFFWSKNSKVVKLTNFLPIVIASQRMANNMTGALIVIAKRNSLKEYIETGETIEANISEHLIENIFYKNSPLHDGAIIIVGDKIKAARCILPTTERVDLPVSLGLRHRAAIGITEESDAISIIVSEQTGEISYVKASAITYNVKPFELKKFLEQEFGRT